MAIIFALLFTLHCFNVATSASLDYNVHWLGENRIERSSTANKQLLDIYCHRGKNRYFVYYFNTVELCLDIENDNFNMYHGSDPENVWKKYKSDSYFWSFAYFSNKKSQSVYINPFNKTCVGISTSENYAVFLQQNDFDLQKITLLILGTFLFLSSNILSENSIFFYAVGVSFGTCASFLIVVYFVSKIFPKKAFVYGSLISGWTVGLYFLQFLWSNFQPFIIMYREYVIWYTVISAFISFIVCYKIGAPKDRKNRNIISWMLQIIALILIQYSSSLIEYSLAFSAILAIIKYIPKSWTNSLIFLWRRKFPPKRILLTDEQYHEQGLKETKKALEELRKYCSSPECKQWELALKLKDPQRFAKFVSANASHVSDDEIDEYDHFEIKRPGQFSKYPPVSSTLRDEDFTSDDSSSSSDEFINDRSTS